MILESVKSCLRRVQSIFVSRGSAGIHNFSVGLKKCAGKVIRTNLSCFHLYILLVGINICRIMEPLFCSILRNQNPELSLIRIHYRFEYCQGR